MKTQNVLRDVDIAKIIDTYKSYTSGNFEEATTEKYSYVATKAEIEENDYNLNIPRYVDTFEEEEPIDLAQVAQQLKEVAERSRSTDATIKQFCDELGINTPF